MTDESKTTQNKNHAAHREKVNKIRSAVPPKEELLELSELFKVFGDSTRLKILCALFGEELSVCCISDIAGISQSATSHQLRVLKANRLVTFRKEGKEVYYRLADDHIKKIYKMGIEHIEEKK